MNLIKLEGISFSYPERTIFENLSFELEAGLRLGIMGPNGTGKTTLVRLIMGLNRPSQGRVIIFGKERRREEDFYEVRARIGFLFQDPDDQLFCPTVAEDVAFGPLNLGWPRQEVEKIVRETLRLLGLKGFENRLIHRLSGGEKRLVALATVLAMKPEALILDEPTGDLDPLNTARLMNVLETFGKSQIIISHDYHFLARLCNRILWLEGNAFKEIPVETPGRNPADTIYQPYSLR